MLQLLTTTELKDAFNDGSFVVKTQEQILKDFQRSGFDIPALEEEKTYNYEALHLIVQEALGEVIKIGEKTLLQLIYQIDLPQQLFLEVVTKSTFLEELSELIIRREALKVYLRSKF